jgi:BMFP domain-containing protein YqiC
MVLISMQNNSGSRSEWADDLVRKVFTLVGSVGEGFKEEARNNLRAIIQNAVSELDIVSRAEFDAQVAVLARTREKIDALEQQLTALSQQLTTDQD